MNMGIFKCLEVLYEKHFEIVVFKDNGKGYRKIFLLWAAQVLQHLQCAKSSAKQEL